MKREEANRISVNYCLTDEQLAEIREAREAADPGAWRVATSPGEAPRVERYNREPWARPEATLRLIALTGYGQAADRSRSAAAGFNAHLVKPVDLSVFQAAIAGHGCSTAA